MAMLKNIGTIILILLVLLMFSCLFQINEGQRGLLLRLGKLSRDADGKVIVYQPGLHFKLPFVNTVRKFDIRLQTMTASQYEVFTQGQKRLLVDYYVKWRIENLAYYYQRVGGYASDAEAMLEKRLNNALRSSVGKIQLLDFISGERVNVMADLRKAADSTANDLGIDVVDVRIKQADLTPEVARAVYERMKSDRKKDAELFRATGKAKAMDIRARANANVQIAIANAEKQAAIIRAEGAKEVAEIYGNAYKRDTEFFSFYRSLQAYLHAFQNRSDLLVLQPQGEFFKYFRDVIAGKKSNNSRGNNQKSSA